MEHVKHKMQKALNFYQKTLLKLKISSDSSLIVMLTPKTETVSGGILSIFSFYYITKKLIKEKNVFICTYPNVLSIFKYKWFRNNVHLINFDFILKSKVTFKSMMLHIPEFLVANFVDDLTEEQIQKLKSISLLHINVMNQNNELMPTVDEFNKLYELTSTITMTTAHKSYTTKEIRDKYKVPVHLLSAWFEQSEIEVSFFKMKKDIIIVSHDEHPLKSRILSKLNKELPHVKQIIINNMKYEDFKKLEAIAKWSLSFGEGFDGYTIFPVLKGGISFAVYNEIFFDSIYQSVPTFYKSYDDLELSIVHDIKKLDNENNYNSYSKLVRAKLTKEYGYDLYMERVRNFYKGIYTIE